jgi:shikimate dehydrogenase
MIYLDRVDPVGKAIGAVNTVVRRSSKLVGANTDAPGALDAIEHTASVKGKTVLILGAGGAARAIAYEAKKRGAEVIVSNRTTTKGEQLAKSLDCTFVSWKSRIGVEFDILVNATPVGMSPHVDDTPFPKRFLRRKVVFDAVYNPPITRLLREAKSGGARIIPGTMMYMNQAALQSEMYTGRKPDMGLMRKLLQIDH